MHESPPKPRRDLLNVLLERFNTEELQRLCFDLRIDFESLPGESKEGKAQGLILYCERRHRTEDLIRAVKEQRPDVVWSDGVSEETTSPAPPVSITDDEQTQATPETRDLPKSPSLQIGCVLAVIGGIIIVVGLVVIGLKMVTSKNSEPTSTPDSSNRARYQDRADPSDGGKAQKCQDGRGYAYRGGQSSRQEPASYRAFGCSI